MKKAIIIVIGVLVILAIVLSVVKSKKSSGSSSKINTEKSERRDIESMVTAFGQVKPRIEVEISAKVTGEIIDLYIEEGDSVERGDTLLKIDPGIYDTRVDQSRASLKSAQASLKQQVANLKQYEIDLNRTRQMYEKGLVSKNELEQIETRYEVQGAVVSSSENSVENAQSQLEQSIEELSYTTITSPQKGLVIGLSKEVGEYVIVSTMNNPGSVIMTIAQLDSMEVEVNVDETDVIDLREGQGVKISFDAIADTNFAGVVRKIGNKALITQASRDETIANFPVEISIVEVPDQIRSGMSVTTEIITQVADSAVSVPIQSIITGYTKAEINMGKVPEEDKTEREDKEFVFINDNGIAKKVEIETGIADANYIEVKTGLEPDVEVIIGPYQELRNLYDGKSVDVSKEEEEAKEKGKGVSIKIGT